MTGAKSDLVVWMHPNGWAWDAGGHIKCSIIAIVVTIADGIVKSEPRTPPPTLGRCGGGGQSL
jgi:hypothetical protein